MALSSEIESDIFEKVTEVHATERDGRSMIRFSPGLDEETITEVQARLSGDSGDREWERVSGRWDSLFHGGNRKNNDSFTNIEVAQNHFGIYRHHRAEVILDAVRDVLLGEMGIRVELRHTPQDFYLRALNVSLASL